MRSSIRLLLCLLLAGLSVTACLCQVTSVRTESVDTVLVRQAAFIAFIKVISNEGDKFTFDTEMVFKGRENRVRMWGNTTSFAEEGRYLIYAGASNDGKYYLDQGSRVVAEREIGNEIDFLLSFLPCIDQKLKEASVNGACLRSMMPSVCGCNGRTYHSDCEARRDGVLMYRNGDCN